MVIEIRKFDRDLIPYNKIVLFIGKRLTGKSFCIRDYLLSKRTPIIKVISLTERANGFYGKFIQQENISYQFSASEISDFLEKQKLQEREKSTLVIDDVFMIKDIMTNNHDIKEMFINGRFYDISVLISMQYCMEISPALRGNVDYIFIFRENRYNEREKIYERYAGIIPSFDIFCRILDKCTMNYGCLVIDNGSCSNYWKDRVFHFRAKQHPNPEPEIILLED